MVLVTDHKRLPFKDKAIRRLEKEKEEAQTALALLRSEKESSPKVDIISVYQLAKQHDELTNKMANQGLFLRTSLTLTKLKAI